MNRTRKMISKLNWAVPVSAFLLMGAGCGPAYPVTNETPAAYAPAPTDSAPNPYQAPTTAPTPAPTPAPNPAPTQAQAPAPY